MPKRPTRLDSDGIPRGASPLSGSPHQEPAGPWTQASRVSAIIVTHASAGVIEACLAALPDSIERIVVDNASPDDTAARARAAGATVIEAENRGFGAGCNRGIAAATREFILLLNPDARLAPGALEALITAADAFPDAAILAPLILGDHGTPIRSWDASQARRRHLARDRAAEPFPSGPLCADFVSGACMLIRRADHLRFDEAFFLYYEDDALCASARTLGRSVLLTPEARIAHAGGRSSAPSPAIAWRKSWHMAWSRQRFLAHHGEGPDAAARLAHHAAKALGHALTLRPAKLRADIAGFCGTLAWLTGRR